jgi:hypothetical protein
MEQEYEIDGPVEDYSFVDIEVQAPSDEQKAEGIAKRLLKGMGIDPDAPPPIEKSKRKREKKEKFFRAIVPAVSKMAVKIAAIPFHDGYEECVPLIEEVEVVLAPISNIMDRHIDISTKFGPDAEDALDCFFAAGNMLIRMWGTKVQLDRKKEKEDERRGTVEGRVGRAMRNGQTRGDYRTEEDPVQASQLFQTGGGYDPAVPASNGNAGTGEVVPAPPDIADRIISQALHRDFNYRLSNGLL